MKKALAFLVLLAILGAAGAWIWSGRQPAPGHHLQRPRVHGGPRRGRRLDRRAPGGAVGAAGDVRAGRQADHAGHARDTGRRVEAGGAGSAAGDRAGHSEGNRRPQVRRREDHRACRAQGAARHAHADGRRQPLAPRAARAAARLGALDEALHQSRRRRTRRHQGHAGRRDSRRARRATSRIRPTRARASASPIRRSASPCSRCSTTRT